MQPLVIVGGGMAATRLVERLRGSGFERPITIVSGERSLPYNRVLLSEVLGGETDVAAIGMHDDRWFRNQDVSVLLGDRATSIDLSCRRVETAGGRTIDYSKLVLATGARANVPDHYLPLPDNAVAFRTLADCEWMEARIGHGAAAVVAGGGLLGVEAATALAARGCNVTLVHRGKWLMNRQLDRGASELLAGTLRERGVQLELGAEISRLGSSVMLDNGVCLPAEMIVLATGIVPDTALAEAAGIATARGVLVDCQFGTSAPDVYAIGECCEINGETAGLLAPIWEQVDQLASHLASAKQFDAFEVPAHIIRLKVSGIDVHVMGRVEVPVQSSVHYSDTRSRVYRKLNFNDRKLTGAILMGDLRHSSDYLEMIRNGETCPDPVALQFTGTSQPKEETCA